MSDEAAPSGPPVGSESNPAAPKPRRAKASAAAEPTFSSSGGSMGPDDTMSVNPTPKAATEPYTPDPFGGKGGPTRMLGEDLARRGGGPEQRVDDRQAALVKKIREDKGIQKIIRDETKRGFGGMLDQPPTNDNDNDAAGNLSTNDQKVEGTDEPGAKDEKPKRSKEDIDAIAKLQREKREFNDKWKAAQSERSEAAQMRKLRELFKDYPIAAAAAFAGMEQDEFTNKIYQDDVAGRSKGAGDRVKVDPKAIEADLAKADEQVGRNSEAEQERDRANQLERQLASERAIRQVSGIVRGDSKRWELCNRDSDIGTKVVAEAQKLMSESGWRPKDDKEATEFTASILDDMEKDYEELGKRYARGPAPSKRPAPPPNQRQPQRSYTENIDRYGKPPKRQSVEDRQDALIAKYRGMSFTGD